MKKTLLFVVTLILLLSFVYVYAQEDMTYLKTTILNGNRVKEELSLDEYTINASGGNWFEVNNIDKAEFVESSGFGKNADEHDINMDGNSISFSTITYKPEHIEVVGKGEYDFERFIDSILEMVAKPTENDLNFIDAKSGELKTDKVDDLKAYTYIHFNFRNSPVFTSLFDSDIIPELTIGDIFYEKEEDIDKVIVLQGRVKYVTKDYKIKSYSWLNGQTLLAPTGEKMDDTAILFKWSLGMNGKLIILGAVLLLVLLIISVFLIKDKNKNGSIKCVEGQYKGAKFTLENDNDIITIGTDPAKARVIIEENKDKVSKLHCSIRYDKKTKEYIVKDNSNTGTFNQDGTPLTANTENTLKSGDKLCLGDENNIFKLL